MSKSTNLSDFAKQFLFSSARLKLTFWYVMIILTINLTISSLFFQRTNTVLEREFAKIEERIEQAERLSSAAGEPNRPGSDRVQLTILRNNLDQTRQKILWQLVTINAFIAVLAGVSSFWLAGQTLQPIQETMEEQKRFIGDAAHELKTPLTALRSSIEVELMGKKKTSATTQLLNDLLIDVSDLQNLIGSLLQLAKVEDAQLQLQKVTLQPLLQKAIKQAKTLAQKKNITIEYASETKNVRHDHTYKVMGDPSMLVEVFLIFLDNAIKYSPQNTKINVSFSASVNQLKVSISDQGIGIAKHHLPHVFERFYRVDAARKKEAGHASGYGLGLSIAHKILDWHHASVKVISQIDKGTTFTLTFPRVR